MAKAKKKVVKKKAAVKKKKVVKKVAKKVVKKPVAKKAPVKKVEVKTTKVNVTSFVTPLDDRMIVQVSAAKEKMTAGGLYIPDTVSNVAGHREGVVISVGRGHQDKKGRVRPMDVKKGDKVLFSEYSGSKITHQGQELVILRETDVMGVKD